VCIQDGGYISKTISRLNLAAFLVFIGIQCPTSNFSIRSRSDIVSSPGEFRVLVPTAFSLRAAI